MKENRFYQFHKIIYAGIGILILYISIFTNKCQSILEYFAVALFIIGMICLCGFSYSFDNNYITKYWYFIKRSYNLAEIHMVVNFKSDMKKIKFYFKSDLTDTSKRIEYLRKLIDYSDGIEISYWFQREKMKSLISKIVEMNSRCIFIVKGDIVSVKLFWGTL